MAANGERWTFEQFYQYYRPWLLKYVVTHLGCNHEDAEDVVQETMVRAYDKLAEIKDHEVAYGWLSQVATRVFIDLRRKNRGVRKFLDLSKLPDPIDSLDDDCPLPHGFAADLAGVPGRMGELIDVGNELKWEREEMAERLGVSLHYLRSSIAKLGIFLSETTMWGDWLRTANAHSTVPRMQRPLARLVLKAYSSQRRRGKVWLFLVDHMCRLFMGESKRIHAWVDSPGLDEIECEDGHLVCCAMGEFLGIASIHLSKLLPKYRDESMKAAINSFASSWEIAHSYPMEAEFKRHATRLRSRLSAALGDLSQQSLSTKTLPRRSGRG